MPIAEWESKDFIKNLEDVGPVVEHVYEVSQNLQYNNIFLVVNLFGFAWLFIVTTKNFKTIKYKIRYLRSFIMFMCQS